MTSRLCGPTNAADPGAVETVPLWRFWKRVGLAEMAMVGWWEDEPLVETGEEQVRPSSRPLLLCHRSICCSRLLMERTFVLQVKATVWRRNATATDSDGDAALPSLVVAIGNFGDLNSTVTLKGAVLEGRGLRAVAVEGFQPARTFAVGEAVPVQAKRGWLLEG